VPNFEQMFGSLLDHELHNADSTVRFTSTRRAQAVNDGIQEFANYTECFQRVSTVTCSCNTTTYDLLSSAVMSTDFVRIAARGAEYHLLSSHGGSSAQLTQVAGDDFPRRDIEWLNVYEPGWRTSTTPSIPVSYYVDDSDGRYLLGLYPPPDIGSSEVGKMLVPYVARPPVLTSTGDIPYTVGSNVRRDLWGYHQAAVHWAAHQLEKLRGDDQASDRQFAKFMAFVDRFMGQKRQKGGTTVRLLRNYLADAQRGSRGTGAIDRDPYWRG
jgi:hypothetical protein